MCKIDSWRFPGGSVGKNLLAHAGTSGLIPDPGRSHPAAEQLGLGTTTIEPVC